MYRVGRKSGTKELKQIKGKLKLKINFDWNQPNLKVIVTDTFKKKKGCFIPIFLHYFHYSSRKSLVRDLRPTLYLLFYDICCNSS